MVTPRHSWAFCTLAQLGTARGWKMGKYLNSWWERQRWHWEAWVQCAPSSRDQGGHNVRTQQSTTQDRGHGTAAQLRTQQSSITWDTGRSTIGEHAPLFPPSVTNPSSCRPPPCLLNGTRPSKADVVPFAFWNCWLWSYSEPILQQCQKRVLERQQCTYI